MIWYIIQTIIGMTLVKFAADAYIYYFGWIDYNEEKEKKRKKILDEYGIIILLCGILMSMAGMVVLFFSLPILMYGG